MTRIAVRPVGRSGRIHPTAEIGNPPEDRSWEPTQAMFPPEVDPTARVNAFVTVDAGLRQATRVGARSFLMTKSHVGHDAQVGADCDLAPGTVVGGHAVLGDGVKCGIGALILPFRTVGDGAIIGAGAVVTKDVPAHAVVVGNPARVVDDKNDVPYTERCESCGAQRSQDSHLCYECEGFLPKHMRVVA